MHTRPSTENAGTAPADERTAGTDGGHKPVFLVILAGVVVLGVALTLYRIGVKSFWVDEGSSVWVASLDWPRFFQVVTESEANAGLYYFLLHLWMGLGSSEGFLRALSLLFAVGTIPMLYALMMRLFARPMVALAACVVFVVNAYFVHYAQEARGYALAMLLVSTGSYFFVRIVQGGGRGAALGYALAMSAALYAHFFAFFVILAHVASLPLRGLRRLPYRKLGLAGGELVLLSAPLVLFALTKDVGQVDWLRRPQPGYLLTALKIMTGEASQPQLILVYGALAVAAIAGALVERFTRSERSQRAWGVGLVLLWGLVPVVGSFVVSQYKPLFHPRFLIVALPALASIAALGMAALRVRVLSAAAFVVVIALAVPSLPRWYKTPKEPWREVFTFVASRSQPGDVIVSYAPTVRRTLEYYVVRNDAADEFPEPAFPVGDWGEYPVKLVPFHPDVPRIRIASANAQRVWYAVGHAPRRQRIRLEAVILSRCPHRVGQWFRFRLSLYDTCGTTAGGAPPGAGRVVTRGCRVRRRPNHRPIRLSPATKSATADPDRGSGSPLGRN